MRALFITTETSDSSGIVEAYRGAMGETDHVTFTCGGEKRDEAILDEARVAEPDVIFYIGGESGPGLPDIATFKELRELAPLVHMAGDFADPPWWPVLETYKANECFDLTVALDGNRDAPVDHVTLTPINMAAFPDGTTYHQRPVRCGFTGNLVDKMRYDHIFQLYGTFDPRSKFLHELGEAVTLRQRELEGPYANYVDFMRDCQMIINTAWTGSGKAMHVKGRVLEAAFAGCALFEMYNSPAYAWFPPGMIMQYSDADDAKKIIRHATDDKINDCAKKFGDYAREHYNPQKIYAGILNKLG